MSTATYGVVTDYDYSATHKRERLIVWSGPWFSVYEAEAFTLPHRDGYMVTTYNGAKVRVTCPTPRTDENFQQVDEAIAQALDLHYEPTTSPEEIPTRSTHWCQSCRKDIEDCHCPTTLHWRERAWARREREAAANATTSPEENR